MNTIFESPVGELVLVGDGRTLTSLVFRDRLKGGLGRHDATAFPDARRQLREYFDGERTTFDLEFHAHGTDFQRKVWAALDAIPYGATTTYGKVAERIGAPRDRIRAVGAAIGANPLPIVRACHRVIGADGRLTGYAGGVERKHFLLTHEGALQPQLV